MRLVFLTFLRLGLTSFGGPIAHLAYFRREFVERRAWVDAPLFGQIVAFCSILPGPTSSQVGLVIGLLRAGPAGALAAWLGFTLPSALALTLLAALLASRDDLGAPAPWLNGILAGLAAAATAVVAHAVSTMARAACTDRTTRSVAAGAAIVALAFAAGTAWQWVPIAAGALIGAAFDRKPGARAAPPTSAALGRALPPWASVTAAIAFVALIAGATVADRRSPGATFAATIVRSGALVFGGGHVVLPLLASMVPSGLLSNREFYAGYGAAQAVPGPLFTFAAYLGEANHSPLHGALGAAVATVLIFAPSFLLVGALLPALGALQANPAAVGALRGANAAVVGLLGALLYTPLIASLESSVARAAIALTTFTLIGAWSAPPWLAVAVAAALGALAAALGLLH
jgi:chromate transporter